MLIVSVFVGVIRCDDWGVDESPVVVSPDVQDIKLFAKWRTDDVQVSDISLTVSVTSHSIFKLLLLELHEFHD